RQLSAHRHLHPDAGLDPRRRVDGAGGAHYLLWATGGHAGPFADRRQPPSLRAAGRRAAGRHLSGGRADAARAGVRFRYCAVHHHRISRRYRVYRPCPAESCPMIVTTDVTKAYGTTTVVNGVSLSLPSGGITSIIGPNGAGK